MYGERDSPQAVGFHACRGTSQHGTTQAAPRVHLQGCHVKVNIKPMYRNMGRAYRKTWSCGVHLRLSIPNTNRRGTAHAAIFGTTRLFPSWTGGRPEFFPMYWRDSGESLGHCMHTAMSPDQNASPHLLADSDGIQQTALAGFNHFGLKSMRHHTCSARTSR